MKHQQGSIAINISALVFLVALSSVWAQAFF
jgi:hypothetical protein